MENRTNVAVVLGAAVWKGGIASPSLKRRMEFAIELFNKDYADCLLLTGGVGQHPPSEARVMRDLSLDAGIDATAIKLEEYGKTTWHSAQECSKIIKNQPWTTVIIVTDRYHMLRSLLAFRSFGVKVIPCSICIGHSGTSTFRWYYLYLREMLALPYYAVLYFRLKLKKLLAKDGGQAVNIL